MASLMPPVASQHLCAGAARTPVRPCQLATAAAQGAPQLRSQYKLRWAAPARRQGRQSASGRVPAPAAQGGAASGGGGGGGAGAQQEQQEQGYIRALLLAWFASQHRSLFAAKCLVETVTEMYREGYTLDDVKLSLSLAGFAYGGKLLSPLHEDLLLSWVALVMMTLKTVGVPPYPRGVARLEARGSSELTESTGRMTMGLQMFVKQSLDLYLQGTDLYRLQLQQSMTGPMETDDGDEAAAGPSPFIQIMQQNTRLVIITLEFVKAQGLPTDISLRQAPPPASFDEASSIDEEDDLLLPSVPSTGGGALPERGLLVGFVPSFLQPAGAAGAGGSVGAYGAGCGDDLAVLKRSAAVRLLIGFMGAAGGWLYSAWDFIDAATDCYQLGWTCDELFTQLKDEEFAQSGGVFPVGVAGMGQAERINAQLFANWLSLVYITMAQLGVPHPGAEEQVGWAWVCSLGHDETAGPAALQAQGMADFVSATLRREAESEREAAGAAAPALSPSHMVSQRLAEETRTAAAAGGGAGGAGGGQEVQQRPQEQGGFVVVQDEALARTSGFALLLSQQISLVQMTRRRVLEAAAPATVAAAAAGA